MEGYLTACAVVDGKPQPSFSGLHHVAGQPAYVLYSKGSALSVEIFKPFSERPDVDVKYLYLYVRIVFLQAQACS